MKLIRKKYDRELLFNLKELNERNWTNGLIKTFLGEPDDFRTNSFYASAAPSKLYLKERVFQEESKQNVMFLLEEIKQKRIYLKEKSNENKEKKVALKKQNLEKELEIFKKENILSLKENINKFNTKEEFLKSIENNYTNYSSEKELFNMFKEEISFYAYKELLQIFSKYKEFDINTFFLKIEKEIFLPFKEKFNLK